MMLLYKDNKFDFETWLSAARNDGAFVLVDKPAGWTSFDVVAKLRSTLKVKKIGHAGTLDPAATGLLIIGCGKATKRLEEFQNLSKEYTGEIKLGATTKTDDSEAPEENIKDASHISLKDIIAAKEKLTGKILQTPPLYSAKHVQGKRAYALARKEKEFEIPASEVEIYSFDIAQYNPPVAEFLVQCSKGTYIRSLARDLGEILKCGAYLLSLRRSAIGNYSAGSALNIEEISRMAKELIEKNANL